jgi:DNA polymerase-1
VEVGLSLDNVQLHLIETLEDVGKFTTWLGQVRNSPELSFDTESTGLSQENDHVRLVQVGDDVHGWAMSWERWSGAFADLIKVYDGTLVAHNAPFDWGMLKSAGVDVPRRRIRDTRPMCHITDPTFSTALKNNAVRYVDSRAKNAQEDFSGTGWTWATVPIDYGPYWSYGALDPVLTQQLHNVLWPNIHGTAAEKAFDIENSVQWVTHDMERYGVHIDTAYARENYDKFTAHCEKIKQWCVKEYSVDPGRNTQVIQRLHNDGVVFTKATKGGAVSLDAEVLEGIDHPLARQVLVRRRLEKLASTYLQHYITEVDSNDLLHPSINTLGARTSRMSMSGPNFQNLPRVSETNPAATVIRNCISAREDHTLLFCDFSQIEMRILAWLAQDENMTAAFKSDGDFFVNLARQLYDDPTITKGHPLRDRIKNVGYGKIYGAGLAKLAWTAGTDVETIRVTMRDFDARFAGVRAYQDSTYQLAMQRKSREGVAYATCPLSGRRQPSESGKEYALVNYVIQGAAASLFKMKLLELDQAGLGPWMMLVVHDEVILDVPNEHVEDAVHTLHSVMNDDMIIAPVPVEAEISFGSRWGQKMKWDIDGWLSNDWRPKAIGDHRSGPGQGNGTRALLQSVVDRKELTTGG